MKTNGDWSLFVEENMIHNRAEGKGNEQKHADLAVERSLKALVMQGPRYCVLRYKKVFVLTLQH